MANHTFYEQTLDILAEKTIELEKTLMKYRLTRRETETLKFLDSIVWTMKHTWDTFLDFRNIWHEMEMLKMENEFLKDRCRKLQSELARYTGFQN